MKYTWLLEQNHFGSLYTVSNLAWEYHGCSEDELGRRKFGLQCSSDWKINMFWFFVWDLVHRKKRSTFLFSLNIYFWVKTFLLKLDEYDQDNGCVSCGGCGGNV